MDFQLYDSEQVWKVFRAERLPPLLLHGVVEHDSCVSNATVYCPSDSNSRKSVRHKAHVFASISLPNLFPSAPAANGQSDISALRSAPPPISPGDMLHQKRYKVDSLYGEGISSQFWKATDLKNGGRHVMIKARRTDARPTLEITS
jgi:hypothetical protein